MLGRQTLLSVIRIFIETIGLVLNLNELYNKENYAETKTLHGNGTLTDDLIIYTDWAIASLTDIVSSTVNKWLQHIAIPTFQYEFQIIFII